MRVLHIISTLETGGAEKLMVDLLPRLNNLGVGAELLVLNGKRTFFYEQLEKKGVRILTGASDSIYSIKNFFCIRKLLNNYDIVHTHTTAPQMFTGIASIGKKVKLCTTEHTTFNRRRKHKWFRLIDRYVYSRYEHVICISNGVKDQLLRYQKNHFPTNISVITNGIDTREYNNALPLKLINNTQSITLIQVASFRIQKDQDTLIRALAKLPHNYYAIFAGDGPRLSECKTLAKEMGVLDQCFFLGIRHDLPSLIKGSDIVVVSSRIEGFGLAAVEGMACGKPVIASDIDGLKDIVGGAGILFKVGDSYDLSEVIMKLSNDNNYNSVKDRCFKRAQMYDIDNMTKQYVQIYNNLFDH